ncbi:MAG TPA: NAD-binding protein [Kofleriaceae bacterium]|nr:NAD-binding protein [Kofleriaceae bacterium]
MKFISTQLTYLLSQREVRQNLALLLKYVAFLVAVIIVYAIAFHFIMAYEGQKHSWVTGVYWTLTVMSTLGFGDITFTSDLGRLFSILVLMSGIMMLLIVLPFAFIRFFYAPWLEAQVKSRAPRSLPAGTSGHVVICEYDPIARDLIERLKLMKVPYYLLEKDPSVAAEYHVDGISVIAGDPESPTTWNDLHVRDCRAVIANSNDPRNTNITLTIRQQAPDVPIIANVDSADSVDILELAGATEVLPIKQKLGESLANRVNAGHSEAHIVGEFRGLIIAEFPAHNTPLIGRTLRETNLRQAIGINVVGVWERGRFESAGPDRRLSDSSVPVVIGTRAQIDALNELLVIYDTNYSPTLVIGGGKVGCAAAAALRRRDVSVHIVERDESLARRISGAADRIIVGDAADREILLGAGLAEAPAVILSTNDDSINAYLSIYCRRLNPELRIISRITHDRNLEAIHRAGADFVMSYSLLGAESMVSLLQHRELMMFGAGVELFDVKVPRSFVGVTLEDSKIGARTGLNVIAVEHGGSLITNPRANMLLPAGGDLLMLGSPEQRLEFMRLFP